MFSYSTPHAPTESCVGGCTNASMNQFFSLGLVPSIKGNYGVTVDYAEEQFVHILRSY